MKRLLVTILALLYLGTSTGATVHLHYCMGKLVDMKLWHSPASKCGSCGMKRTACAKKCCKEDHKLVKLEKAHQKASQNTFQFTQAVPATPAAFIEFLQIYIPSVTQELPVSHGPPESIPIHILHCTFRI